MINEASKHYFKRLNLTPKYYEKKYGISSTDDIGDCVIRALAFCLDIPWLQVIKAKNKSITDYPDLIDADILHYGDNIMQLDEKLIPTDDDIKSLFSDKIVKTVNMPEYRFSYYLNKNENPTKKKIVSLSYICEFSKRQKWKKLQVLYRLHR